MFQNQSAQQQAPLPTSQKTPTSQQKHPDLSLSSFISLRALIAAPTPKAQTRQNALASPTNQKADGEPMDMRYYLTRGVAKGVVLGVALTLTVGPVFGVGAFLGAVLGDVMYGGLRQILPLR